MKLGRSTAIRSILTGLISEKQMAANADIRDVDFGRLDSESDPKLGSFFLDTGAVERIVSGERKFVIGRKGSGKTALFKEAKPPGTQVVHIEFDAYAWDAHKAIRELGMTGENAYTASWTFTFLVAACRAWMKSPVAEVKEAAKKIHLKIYGSDEGGTLDILVDRLKRLRKLDLPNAGDIGGLGGVEFSDQIDGVTLARAANAWSQHLLDLAERAITRHPISVFIDRMDDGWDASQEMMQLLAGAMKAARALNIRFQPKTKAPFVVLFLRSDIFRFINFNDKAKLGQDIERIEWTDDALIAVARKRIAESCPVPVNEAWEAVFSSERIRQRTTIQRYILKRTMRRPRDLIAFCQACQDAARQRGEGTVTKEALYAAEHRYSLHIYDELIDEMHKQLPDVDSYFAALNRIGYSKFSSDQWEAAVGYISPGCRDPSAWLNELYKYAVVGVPKVGGRSGGSTVEFIYDTAFPQTNLTGEVVVHPALIKHLRLKEGSAADSTPVEYDEADSEPESTS